MLKPITFIDIDGVLNPFLANPEAIEDYEVIFTDWATFHILKSMVNGYVI